MQNKSTLKVIILVLSLICLYELSFTYMTKQVEKEVAEEADGDFTLQSNLLKEKESEEVWMGYTYMECKKREINLGLDLRGGMSVTLEISISELIESMAGSNAKTDLFKEVAAKATELQKNSQAPYVDLFYQAYTEIVASKSQDAKFVTWFLSRDHKEFTLQTSDEEVLEALRQYSEEAINQANEVLRSRVKQFGIAQPDIRKLGSSGRIIVDLPGVKNKKRVRALLQGSANLQMYDVYSWAELSKEAALLGDNYKALFDKNIDTTKQDVETEDSLASDVNEFDEQPAQFNNYFAAAPYSRSPFYFSVLEKDAAKVDSFLSLPATQKLLPRNSQFAWASSVEEGPQGNVKTAFLLKADRRGNPAMEGDIIDYSRASLDQNGRKIVELNFKSSYVKKWEDLTTKSHNNSTPIAIVLDGIVFSAPTAFQGPIENGRTQISGDDKGNPKWNVDLANVLNAGKFPAPAKIVEESFNGPSLGAEAIQAGFLSFAIALIIVLIYMMFYYSTAGWVANVALIGNIFFIIGALAAAPTLSLTLPGLAGIVLTVGMSVDANVLIYERIREELRSGKGLKTAIADGYKNSYTAILDANITTLITGLILWYFGTGVIESFAQTLVIGIFTSLFSAIFITRLVFESLLGKEKKIKFGTAATENLFANSAVKFVQNKKKFYIASLLIIAIGFASIFTKGFDLGTDFTGGRTFKVQFTQHVDLTEARSALATVFVDEKGDKMVPEVKTYGDASKLAITTKYLYEDQSKDASVKVEKALFNGLASFFPAGTTYESFSAQADGQTTGLMNSYTVGPSIADDIIDSAFTSIIIALIAIFLYVAIRFRKWQFGVGALTAIFHDVLIVLSLFSLFYGILPFSLEINQAFIAAILTVVGYSINDTVVVFDRIRETLLPGKKTKVVDEVVNEALNSTLSRTFNTSITIIVVLLSILLFGGDSIKGFAFALLIGVVVGTYSSLCIAAPVFVDLESKKSIDQSKA